MGKKSFGTCEKAREGETKGIMLEKASIAIIYEQHRNWPESHISPTDKDYMLLTSLRFVNISPATKIQISG